MKRILPNTWLESTPCLIVSVCSALRCGPVVFEADDYPKLRDDGYATLNAANKWIRSHLNVRKRVTYKRGERPKLRELDLDGEAIVCVLGHYIYADKDTYWSFFDNDDDEVVTVWLLK